VELSQIEINFRFMAVTIDMNQTSKQRFRKYLSSNILYSKEYLEMTKRLTMKFAFNTSAR